MSNLWTLGPSGGLLAADLTHTRVLLAQSFQKWKPSTEMHTLMDASPYFGKVLKSTSFQTGLTCRIPHFACGQSIVVPRHCVHLTPESCDGNGAGKVEDLSSSDESERERPAAQNNNWKAVQRDLISGIPWPGQAKSHVVPRLGFQDSLAHLLHCASPGLILW
jgi:hypothetical protein